MNDAYVTPSESAEEVPSSGSAIASLVLSLIVCVPGLSLIAVILGFVGLSATSGGARRGRGMAIAGVVLGLLVSVAWIGIGIVGYRAVDAFGGSIVFVIKAPTETMKAAFNDDFAAVQGKFKPGNAPSDDSITAFAQALEARYGAFNLAEPASSGGPPPGQEQFSMPYTFKFVNGTIGGKVLFEIDEEGLSSDAKSFLVIQRIDIDGDGEDKPPLTLGGASPASNTGPAESTP